jgi:hypothetical protein
MSSFINLTHQRYFIYPKIISFFKNILKNHSLLLGPPDRLQRPWNDGLVWGQDKGPVNELLDTYRNDSCERTAE